MDEADTAGNDSESELQSASDADDSDPEISLKQTAQPRSQTTNKQRRKVDRKKQANYLAAALRRSIRSSAPEQQQQPQQQQQRKSSNSGRVSAPPAVQKSRRHQKANHQKRSHSTQQLSAAVTGSSSGTTALQEGQAPFLYTDPLGLTTCSICGGAEDEDLIVLCDAPHCKSETHLYCLNPVLTAVPEGDWYCDLCDAAGSTRHLIEYFRQFQVFCDNLRPTTAEIYNQCFLPCLQERLLPLQQWVTASTAATTITSTDNDIIDGVYQCEFDSSAVDLIGCLVRVFSTVDCQYHTGRIMRRRCCNEQQLHRWEHFVQFKSGADGRNCPFATWLCLKEHICLVGAAVVWARTDEYRWWPAQIFLQSGLERFIKRHYAITTTTAAGSVEDGYTVYDPLLNGLRQHGAPIDESTRDASNNAAVHSSSATMKASSSTTVTTTGIDAIADADANADESVVNTSSLVFFFGEDSYALVESDKFIANFYSKSRESRFAQSKMINTAYAIACAEREELLSARRAGAYFTDREALQQSGGLIDGFNTSVLKLLCDESTVTTAATAATNSALTATTATAPTAPTYATTSAAVVGSVAKATSVVSAAVIFSEFDKLKFAQGAMMQFEGFENSASAVITEDISATEDGATEAAVADAEDVAAVDKAVTTADTLAEPDEDTRGDSSVVNGIVADAIVADATTTDATISTDPTIEDAIQAVNATTADVASADNTAATTAGTSTADATTVDITAEDGTTTDFTVAVATTNDAAAVLNASDGATLDADLLDPVFKVGASTTFDASTAAVERNPQMTEEPTQLSILKVAITTAATTAAAELNATSIIDDTAVAEQNAEEFCLARMEAATIAGNESTSVVSAVRATEYSATATAAVKTIDDAIATPASSSAIEAATEAATTAAEAASTEAATTTEATALTAAEAAIVRCTDDTVEQVAVNNSPVATNLIDASWRSTPAVDHYNPKCIQSPLFLATTSSSANSAAAAAAVTPLPLCIDMAYLCTEGGLSIPTSAAADGATLSQQQQQQQQKGQYQEEWVDIKLESRQQVCPKNNLLHKPKVLFFSNDASKIDDRSSFSFSGSSNTNYDVDNSNTINFPQQDDIIEDVGKKRKQSQEHKNKQKKKQKQRNGEGEISAVVKDNTAESTSIAAAEGSNTQQRQAVASSSSSFSGYIFQLYRKRCAELEAIYEQEQLELRHQKAQLLAQQRAERLEKKRKKLELLAELREQRKLQKQQQEEVAEAAEAAEEEAKAMEDAATASLETAAAAVDEETAVAVIGSIGMTDKKRRKTRTQLRIAQQLADLTATTSSYNIALSDIDRSQWLNCVVRCTAAAAAAVDNPQQQQQQQHVAKRQVARVVRITSGFVKVRCLNGNIVRYYPYELEVVPADSAEFDNFEDDEVQMICGDSIVDKQEDDTDILPALTDADAGADDFTFTAATAISTSSSSTTTAEEKAATAIAATTREGAAAQALLDASYNDLRSNDDDDDNDSFQEVIAGSYKDVNIDDTEYESVFENDVSDNESDVADDFGFGFNSNSNSSATNSLPFHSDALNSIVDTTTDAAAGTSTATALPLLPLGRQVLSQMPLPRPAVVPKKLKPLRTSYINFKGGHEETINQLRSRKQQQQELARQRKDKTRSSVAAVTAASVASSATVAVARSMINPASSSSVSSATTATTATTTTTKATTTAATTTAASVLITSSAPAERNYKSTSEALRVRRLSRWERPSNDATSSSAADNVAVVVAPAEEAIRTEELSTTATIATETAAKGKTNGSYFAARFSPISGDEDEDNIQEDGYESTTSIAAAAVATTTASTTTIATNTSSTVATTSYTAANTSSNVTNTTAAAVATATTAMTQQQVVEEPTATQVLNDTTSEMQQAATLLWKNEVDLWKKKKKIIGNGGGHINRQQLQHQQTDSDKNDVSAEPIPHGEGVTSSKLPSPPPLSPPLLLPPQLSPPQLLPPQLSLQSEKPKEKEVARKEKDAKESYRSDGEVSDSDETVATTVAAAVQAAVAASRRSKSNKRKRNRKSRAEAAVAVPMLEHLQRTQRRKLNSSSGASNGISNSSSRGGADAVNDEVLSANWDGDINISRQLPTSINTASTTTTAAVSMRPAPPLEPHPSTFAMEVSFQQQQHQQQQQSAPPLSSLPLPLSPLQQQLQQQGVAASDFVWSRSAERSELDSINGAVLHQHATAEWSNPILLDQQQLQQQLQQEQQLMQHQLEQQPQSLLFYNQLPLSSQQQQQQQQQQEPQLLSLSQLPVRKVRTRITIDCMYPQFNHSLNKEASIAHLQAVMPACVENLNKMLLLVDKAGPPGNVGLQTSATAAAATASSEAAVATDERAFNRQSLPLSIPLSAAADESMRWELNQSYALPSLHPLLPPPMVQQQQPQQQLHQQQQQQRLQRQQQQQLQLQQQQQVPYGAVAFDYSPLLLPAAATASFNNRIDYSREVHNAATTAAAGCFTTSNEFTDEYRFDSQQERQFDYQNQQIATAVNMPLHESDFPMQRSHSYNRHRFNVEQQYHHQQQLEQQLQQQRPPQHFDHHNNNHSTNNNNSNSNININSINNRNNNSSNSNRSSRINGTASSNIRRTDRSSRY